MRDAGNQRQVSVMAYDEQLADAERRLREIDQIVWTRLQRVERFVHFQRDFDRIRKLTNPWHQFRPRGVGSAAALDLALVPALRSTSSAAARPVVDCSTLPGRHFVRRLHSCSGGVRFLAPCIIGFGSSPSRCGPSY